MKILKCPRCRSAKIEYFAAALTGQYHCRKCGYIGTLVIEEDVSEEDVSKDASEEDANRLHEE